MTENTAGDDADAATRAGLGILLGRTVSSYVIITTEPCEPGEPEFPVLAANMELEDARELMSMVVAAIDKGKATCISVPDSPEGLDCVLRHGGHRRQGVPH